MSILGLFSISICVAVPSIVYEGNRQIAFQNWNEIPPILILIAIAVYANLLYAPPYILNKTVLPRFKLTFLEKIVFYPVLSGLIFGLLSIIDMHFKAGIFSYLLIVLLLNGALIALLLHDYKSSKLKGLIYTEISVDWLEMLGVIFAAIFNIFIFYSAVGESNAFLRGDMWGEAHRVALLAKYGLNGYLVSPVEGYPPFYSLFWYALTKSLPIPFLNGLLIIAFFNHLFSILALYTFAKMLFKNSRNALLTAILWTTLSGFSWTYLVTNPPLNVLSGNELLNYISQISSRFGVYSGAIVSPIYADDHALTRLWSLGLLFASMATLLKGCYDINPKGEILMFSACFIQILLGHITEIPLLSFALLVLFFLGKPSSKLRMISSAIVFSSGIGAVTLTLLYGLNFVYLFISFTPVLAIIFATVILSGYNILYKRIFRKGLLTRISKKIRSALTILFLYVYGLMWIAVSKSHMWINWPITTIWYFPAIEWGFLGLLTVLALVKLGLSKEKWQFGLKFIMFLLVLQLSLLIALNYLNYNFFYITTPYPLQPILFLPILALIASQAFPTIRFKKSFPHRIKLSLIALLVIMLFSFGSLDHILSASYWKTNNGWWLNKPLNPSYEDYQLINFLYGYSSASPYEFVGTFYGWDNPSSYVVYPSGMTVLSQPLIDILTQANDSREIYLLTSIFPINYVLVSKEQPLPPPISLKFDGVDDYVEVPDSPSLNVSLFTIEAWVKLDAYSEYVCPIVDRATKDGGYSFWIGGKNKLPGTLMLNGGFGNDVISCGSKVELGEWTHVVVVWDGSNVTFYNNGIPNTRSGWVFKDIGALTIRIGNERWAWGGQYFAGNIWQIRIYNRSLSKDEVLHLYKEPNRPILDGLVLWLRMDEAEGNTISDGSGKGNAGTIFGARFRVNSYLAYTVDTINPIFENNKYKLYSINQFKLSKTDLLPSSNKFLTTTRIAFRGDLTLVDKLNGKIYLNNTSGEIRPINKGKVIIHVNSSIENTESNIIALTPSINVKGNITLSDMKSTWGYFSEIRCSAEKLTISGNTSFRIFNSFESRIYIESFMYTGKYKAFPFPTYLRPDYTKEQIKNYLKTNYVSPLSAVATPLGIIWTIIVATVLLLRLVSVRVRVMSQWRRRS